MSTTFSRILMLFLLAACLAPASPRAGTTSGAPSRIVLHLRSGEDLVTTLVRAERGWVYALVDEGKVRTIPIDQIAGLTDAAGLQNGPFRTASLQPYVWSPAGAVVPGPARPRLAAAPAGPSLAGPLMLGAAVITGVAGFILVEKSEKTHTYTRTEKPLCLNFWGCGEVEPVERTYTETEIDGGMLLLGAASTMASIGLFTGGIITTLVTGKPRPASPAGASPKRPSLGLAYTHRF